MSQQEKELLEAGKQAIADMQSDETLNVQNTEHSPLIEEFESNL